MRDRRIENPARAALFTDLYELTMAGAYDAEAMEAPAVFELYFRKVPECRNYVVAAGLDDVLDYLEHWRFTDDDLDFLGTLGQFQPSFLARLRELRFTGDVRAVPEGTIVFADEPLLQVVGPLIEAQVVETFVLNQVHFQSVAASKASRVVAAAAGRDAVDFGSRRAHGTEAALKVARVSYLAGAAGTSNVLAGKMYGIPVFGTMAHSYVQAHDDEAAAFKAFVSLYPQTTLVVDTSDTLAAVRKVIALSGELGPQFSVRAVRLDSGDLGELAKRSRELLDEAGLTHVGIFASGGLDEYDISALVASGAPIDGFGVGTKLAVSSDAPYLDMAYKLVEYAGRGRLKLSPAKVVHPGRKQVFRVCEEGRMRHDVIGRHDERLPGEPLIEQVMAGGKRLRAGRVSLEEARRHAQSQTALLPERLRSLDRAPEPYPVTLSEALKQDLYRLARSTVGEEGPAIPHDNRP